MTIMNEGERKRNEYFEVLFKDQTQAYKGNYENSFYQAEIQTWNLSIMKHAMKLTATGYGVEAYLFDTRVWI